MSLQGLLSMKKQFEMDLTKLCIHEEVTQINKETLKSKLASLDEKIREASKLQEAE
jgi:hypothetical protein